MKKILSFILSVLVVAAFSACSDGTAADETTQGAETTVTTVAETTAVTTAAETVVIDIPRLENGDFAFSVTNGEATVTEFIGEITNRGFELVIPAEVEGYPVVAIDDYCFELSISLGSIKIPDSVVTIGKGAFKNCWMLENVELSNNLTNIEASAFDECQKLKSIDIPDSVVGMGEKAFTSEYGITINCSGGSYAEEYAKTNGITYAVK